MGKINEPDGKPKGDLFENDFEDDLTAYELENFLNDPHEMAATLLGTATARIIYNADVFYRTQDALQPTYAAILSRETFCR